MQLLSEEDPDSYKKQFRSYLFNGLDADSIEDMWTEAHAAIRKNPAHAPKKQHTGPHREIKGRKARISLQQRKSGVAQKKANFIRSQEEKAWMFFCCYLTISTLKKYLQFFIVCALWMTHSK